MILPLRRPFDFAGRSPRVEFWSFQLFLLLAFTLAVTLDVMLGTGGERVVSTTSAPGLAATSVETSGGWITGLFGLAMIVPWLALAVRRLHDAGWRGWWLLLGMTGIGGLVLLVLWLTDGQRGPNRFGADPKEPVAAPAPLG